MRQRDRHELKALIHDGIGRGNLSAVADDVGKTYSTLTNEIDGLTSEAPTNKLGLLTFLELLESAPAACAAFLAWMANRHGYLAPAKRPPVSITPETLPLMLPELISEMGDVGKQLKKMLADCKVKPNEIPPLSREIGDVVAVLLSIEAAAKAQVAPVLSFREKTEKRRG